MAKYNALIHSFNVGELSKSGLARLDQERVRLGAEIQENLFPGVNGRAIMRPGLKYLGELVSTQATLDNTPPRLIPFFKSLDTAALLELTYVAGSLDDGQLRVWIDDSIVTYPAVTSTIGAFSTFTTATTGDATVTATTYLEMQCPNQGGTVIAKKEVTTSSADTEHAVKIVISAGKVNFRIGSTDGDDDYFSSATLGVGEHILSFTPAGNYWVRFFTKSATTVTVDSCAIYNSAAIDMSVSSAQWGATDLRKIRHDQSLDVVFLAVDGNPPYAIERRGDHSWSVVEFRSDNGPFMSSRSNTDVRLKPGATRGNTTLTADQPFFDSSVHTGSLFRLTHDNLNATYGLGAEGEYTKPFRQIGIVYAGVDDRNFSVTVSGTWVGTINIQRSYDNEFYGFTNYGADITANGTTNVSGDSSDDNAIVWYRVIFTSYTSGSAQISVSYDEYGWTGICRVTGVDSSTSATIEVLEDFSDVTYTETWRESEWNSSRGFPTAVAFFDGRLWWARKDRYWGSESDSFYSYDETVTGDSASIQRSISTGGAFPEVQWILPLQRLIFGTAGQEISARSSSFDEPLTPNNITMKDASSQGSAAITPVKVDSRGVFVQRSGRKIFQISYNFETNDYVAADLNAYNETICTSLKGVRITDLVDDDLVEIAVQRQPETYIWCLRDDGVVVVLAYEPAEKVLGWFKLITSQSYVSGSTPLQYLDNDKIVSVCVVPGEVEDDVYFVIQRRNYGGGAEGRDYYNYFLEKLGHHEDCVYRELATANTSDVNVYNGKYQCDSYVTGTVAASDDTDYQFMITGVTHLAGYNDSALLSSMDEEVLVIGPYYNSSGSVIKYGPITANSTDYPNKVSYEGVLYFSSSDSKHLTNLIGETVTVGLPYTGKYKSAKLAYGAQQGTSMMAKKRVAAVGVLMSDYNQDGVQIGSDLDADEGMDDLPSRMNELLVDTDTTLIADSDSDLFAFPGVWDTDARVCLKVKPGYSATFHGIVVSMETHEK